MARFPVIIMSFHSYSFYQIIHIIIFSALLDEYSHGW